MLTRYPQSLKIKISVIPNVCDETVFSSSSSNTHHKNSNVFSIITHGSIEERYGHEVIIQAVKLIKEKIPNLQYNIIGEGSHESDLIKLVKKLGCEKYINFLGFLPFDEMFKILKNSDVGIIAMYKTPYSELIDTNKMYEYIALKIPVITSRLAAIEENFNDSCLLYFEPGNADELAQCIFTVYNNAKRRNELITNAYSRYKMIAWNKSKKIYIKLINSLYNNKS